MYESYVSPESYLREYGGSVLASMDMGELSCRLRTASRHIDSLTYNRIAAKGLCALTDFQREIIEEVVCLQAEFEYENSDVIDTILSGYSINGVSVQFGKNWNVFVEKGVAMKKHVYALLCQTGLCCQLVR